MPGAASYFTPSLSSGADLMDARREFIMTKEDALKQRNTISAQARYVDSRRYPQMSMLSAKVLQLVASDAILYARLTNRFYS